MDRFETVTTVTGRSLPSPMQDAERVSVANFSDGMTVVTAGLNHFSPGRVRACAPLRARTRTHPKHTVTTVTTVTYQSKKPVTVAVTVSPALHLLSPTALGKGGRRHV